MSDTATYSPGVGDVVNVIISKQGTVKNVVGRRILVEFGPEEKAVVNANELQLVSKSEFVE